VRSPGLSPEFWDMPSAVLAKVADDVPALTCVIFRALIKLEEHGERRCVERVSNWLSEYVLA
jgi:hypothetical protein